MNRALCFSLKYPPYAGGSFVWMHAINQRLASVRVLTETMEGAERRSQLDGVQVRRIRLQRYGLLRPESLVMYGNFFLHGFIESLRRRPDVILATCALPEGLVATTIGRVLRVPTVVLAHGEEITLWGQAGSTGRRRRLTSRAKQKLMWSVYAKASAVVTNSRFTAELLKGPGVDPAKIKVIHPGTDVEQYRPMPKNDALAGSLGVQGKKVLLTVGRLAPRKGQDTVIRALPQIIRQDDRVVYLIVGTGSYEHELRELAESLDLGRHVKFLGKAPHEQLLELYNLADVFVMPNRRLEESGDFEGFGIVFLEAGACEVPVIGGRSGGVVEAIVDGETGLLVDGNSPESFAAAVMRILGDSELAKRLGQNARRRICNELTWDHSGEAVAAVIDELLRQSSR